MSTPFIAPARVSGLARALLPGLALLVASACAPGPRTAAAVLPVVWRTPDPTPGLDERAPLVRGMREAELDVRTPSPGEPCEDRECARRVGDEAGAAHVVLASMAGLGDTVLTRVTVFGVADGTTELTRQRVLRSADEASAAAALEELGRAVGDSIAPGSDSTLAVVLGSSAAALALGGAAIAVGVALASEQGGPDHTVVPP